jgi:murein DD-endopeptidase MepM/ murein hydrolase activator NlpD
VLTAGAVSLLALDSGHSPAPQQLAGDLEAELAPLPQVLLVSAYHERLAAGSLEPIDRARDGHAATTARQADAQPNALIPLSPQEHSLIYADLAPAEQPVEPSATELPQPDDPRDIARAEPAPQDDATPPPDDLVLSFEIKKGDTLGRLLGELGTDRDSAHAAINALSEVFSPRKLRVGQQLEITYAAPPQAQPARADDPGDDRADDLGDDTGALLGQLLGLSLVPSVERRVEVRRDESGAFVAQAIERPLQVRDAWAKGVITSSLYEAALDSEVPLPVLLEMIRALSFDVDFQRDPQRGDGFELLYESQRDETGQEVKTGKLLYAEMRLSGKTKRLYHFASKSGVDGYFDENGKSVRKTLLRTPIDGARISSGFGKRRHPILGYNKMHKGLDFAARSGTPIYAAGDGVIEKAGRNGGYGKYVRIRHNGTYKTVYAHLSKYGRGIRSGVRVRQGQVIGYVGSTGRSTGPHLHYEVLVNGKQTNPARIKLPSGITLAGADRSAFATTKAEIDARREHMIASAGAEPDEAQTQLACATAGACQAETRRGTPQ